MVPELAQAIIGAEAHKVLTLNVASGYETAGFSPTRHMELVAEHAPGLHLDTVIADETFAGEDEMLGETCAGFGARLVVGDVAMHDNTARHDRLRLAAVYSEIMLG